MKNLIEATYQWAFALTWKRIDELQKKEKESEALPQELALDRPVRDLMRAKNRLTQMDSVMENKKRYTLLVVVTGNNVVLSHQTFNIKLHSHCSSVIGCIPVTLYFKVQLSLLTTY